MSERPWWRWRLFCIALWLHWHTEWEWAGRLYAWCVLPAWMGWTPEEAAAAEAADPEGWPF